MRKHIFVALACALFASTCGAQSLPGGGGNMGSRSGGGSNPGFVQANNALFTTGTSGVVTLGSNITAAHGLFVYEIGLSAPLAPTATGETFVTDTTTAGCQTFSADATQCWYTTSAVGGENAVTCNWTTNNAGNICIVVEFTRPQGLSTPKDAGGKSSTAGATSLAVSTSAATTNSNDFVLACFGGFAIGSNAVSIAGYTIDANAKFVSSGGQAACGYNVTSSTGTQSATGTWTTSMRASGIIMGFKP